MVEKWLRDINKAARKAAWSWPGVIEAEDIAQEVYVKIQEAPGTIRDLQRMDKDSRYRTLHKMAQRIASQARDDYDVFSGNFRYSIGEVDHLMRLVGAYFNGKCDDPFTVESLSSAWSVGDYVSSGRGEHSDPTEDAALDSVQKSSTRADLLAALGKIKSVNADYFEILVRRFVDGERGMSSTERSRLERALRELTTEMNHSRKRQHAGKFEPGKTLGDGPGSRKAISNAAARYISKSAYDADYYPAPVRDNHTEPEVWDQ